MSFQEALLHIRNNMVWLSRPILQLLKLIFFAGPKSKFQILNLLEDHVTHHRGQLIVYLNFKNSIPPSFIGW